MNKEFLEQFWVGLMDGDGSIQVNHWRRRSLQFRLIIKLKYTAANEHMLLILSHNLGGKVRKIFSKGILENIIWVVDERKDVKQIIKIYDKYPPLNSRKICQLVFLRKCLDLQKDEIQNYFNLRDEKYLEQKSVIYNKMRQSIPDYFGAWVSGFIEAEGCFSLRKSKNHSFSIGQNDDEYILNWLKEIFFVTNKIRFLKEKFFFLEVYKKEVLLNIINHCKVYPLMGEKSESLKKFITEFVN